MFSISIKEAFYQAILTEVDSRYRKQVSKCVSTFLQRGDTGSLLGVPVTELCCSHCLKITLCAR